MKSKALVRREVNELAHLTEPEREFVRRVGEGNENPHAVCQNLWPKSDSNEMLSILASTPGVLECILNLQSKRAALATSHIGDEGALQTLDEIRVDPETGPLARVKACAEISKIRNKFYDPTKRRNLQIDQRGATNSGVILMIAKYALATHTREQYDEIVQTLGRCVETGEAVDFVQLLGLNAAPRRPRGKPMKRLPGPEHNGGELQ